MVKLMIRHKETLVEYLKKRKEKADHLRMNGARLQQRDNLATADKGLDMECEAEARLDELDRIWNKFCEKGDK